VILFFELIFEWFVVFLFGCLDIIFKGYLIKVFRI